MKQNMVPVYVQRIEESSSGINTHASTMKPHGVYTTPANVISPHQELGGNIFFWELNPSASVLDLSTSSPIPIREMAIDSGTGVHAASKLLGTERFQQLLGRTKTQLIQWADDNLTKADYGRYYDNQEVLEAIGGQLARQHGFDILYRYDQTMPEFSEVVLLSERAGKPISEVPEI